MPKEDRKFRLLILNQVLLWGDDFRGEGSGNEDFFLNADCCAGPRFQAGKVPPLCPFQCVPLRILATQFFMTQHDRLQRSRLSLVFWAAILLEPPCWHSVLILELRCCGQAVVLVHNLLTTGLLQVMNLFVMKEFMISCAALVLLECLFCGLVALTAHLENLRWSPAALGVQRTCLVTCLQKQVFLDVGENTLLFKICCLLVMAFLGWCENTALQVSPAAAVGEHFSLQVDFASRKPVAERDQLGGPVASRLRHQARSSCLDLRCLTDFVSSSRLGHLFPSPRLVDARVGHTNASVDTNFARVNSWGTLHAARTNSGGHANSYRCTYNSCGGVRGGTKPRSMSTRDQVGCPAVEKLASLQQAPGRLHVETWAGRNENSQDASHVGNAGVGIVSLRGAPLALPLCATAQFKAFFDRGRVIRCTLPLGAGRFMHIWLYCMVIRVLLLILSSLP